MLLQTLLAGLDPVLNEGRYAFVSLPPGRTVDPELIVASVREPEGLSVILAEDDARRLDLGIAFTAAWITLTVASELDAVGLTAVVARALGDAGISCNMIAGTRHDHVFVPIHAARSAMETLRALQMAHRRG